MKLKRRSKAIGDFSMASMTDVIFLLLIFFMVSSTLVVPSARRVLLPLRRDGDTGDGSGIGLLGAPGQ